MNNDFILDTIEINEISQEKRILCYYYYYLQMQGKSLNEMWKDYEKVLATVENWREQYKKFFADGAIDDEKECIKMYYIITKDKDSAIKQRWRTVKNIIKKEKDCEKKLSIILNNQAEEHPIISKIIVVILTTILLGLVKDCIHDAIQENSARNQEKIIYITNEKDQYRKIQYKGNTIIIEDIEKEEK